MTRVVVPFILFFGIYLLFAGSLSVDEVEAGVVFACACSFMSARLRATADRSLHVRCAVVWHRFVGEILVSLLRDFWRVGAILLGLVLGRSGAAGGISLEPIAGMQAGPAAAGRRAILTLGKSVSPNGIVVSVPEGLGVLWVHKLTRRHGEGGMVSIWMMAFLGLLPAICIATAATATGGAAQRLAGVQLLSALVVPALAVLTFAYDQSAFMDLALLAALLNLPATMLFALFLERWL